MCGQTRELLAALRSLVTACDRRDERPDETLSAVNYTAAMRLARLAIASVEVG